MSEDPIYDNERLGDREAVASYLHRLAERIENGEPLPFAPDGERATLTPSSPVKLGVRCRARRDDRTTVRLDLTWQGSDRDSAEADGSPDRDATGNGERERGGTRRGANTGGDRSSSGGETVAPADDLPDPSVGTRNAEKAENEFERAVHFAGKGKTRAADSRFQEAVRADPADPDIRRRFANFLWQVDEHRRATEQFDVARDIAPEDPEIRVDVANFHWSRGDTDAAVDEFEAALEIAPENPDVHSTHGRFLWEELDDVEGAVEHLRRALDIDEEHALAHLNYGVLLRHGGREDAAERHYDRALELGEGNATVHTEYGHYLWAAGDVEEAARHYATARELDDG